MKLCQPVASPSLQGPHSGTSVPSQSSPRCVAGPQRLWGWADREGICLVLPSPTRMAKAELRFLAPVFCIKPSPKHTKPPDGPRRVLLFRKGHFLPGAPTLRLPPTSPGGTLLLSKKTKPLQVGKAGIRSVQILKGTSKVCHATNFSLLVKLIKKNLTNEAEKKLKSLKPYPQAFGINIGMEVMILLMHSRRCLYNPMRLA